MPRSRASSQQALDLAEVLDPQRDRRMFEQSARIVFAQRQQPARAFAFGDVVDRHQDARPGRLVARQQRALDLDVDAPARQRIVDAVAGEAALAVPQLRQLVGEIGQHFVAEDSVEIGDEMRQVVGLEQRQRPAVDPDDAHGGGAGANAGRVLGEIGAQVANARRPPGVEQRLHRAVVLEPQRHRRDFEHHRVVVWAARPRRSNQGRREGAWALRTGLTNGGCAGRRRHVTSVTLQSVINAKRHCYVVVGPSAHGRPLRPLAIGLQPPAQSAGGAPLRR